MSKKFYKDMFICCLLLLLFVGVLACIRELQYRELLQENEQLKQMLYKK